MDTRFLWLGMAAVVTATSASAAPAPNAERRDSAAPKVAEVMLASASQIRSSATAAAAGAQPEAAPAKRPRAARVTSCRCAGQAPAPDQSNQ